MPFKLINGTFHLVGKTKTGKLQGFQPDGDSIQFRPRNSKNLDDLEVVNKPYRLTGIGSVNLRFEGIDAPEIHYGGSRQPAPPPEDARDRVTGEIGMNPVTYTNGVRVKPPVHDGQQGHILTKQLDFHGRPVSFVFVGKAPQDGAWVRLDGKILKRSLNYRLLKRGLAYPLFYDTLYHDLRETMRSAAVKASKPARGLWRVDSSSSWMSLDNKESIENRHTMFPKIFRRLVDYFKDSSAFDEKGFAAWLDEKSENDLVWIRPEWNRTHLDNIVAVKKGAIRMKHHPADLVFVSRRKG